MHASMFPLDLGRDTSSRDRERSGRALAAALAALHGFVAFIALEAENGVMAGFCICVDAVTLTNAQRLVEAWHRDQIWAAGFSLKPFVSGEVVVQRGL